MSRKYTPRRANKKRWLEGAPEYVLDVLWNKKTHDCYTVLLTGSELITDGTRMGTRIPYLTSTEHGSTYCGELSANNAAYYRYRCAHQRIRWNDLPEQVRKAIQTRVESE